VPSVPFPFTFTLAPRPAVLAPSATRLVAESGIARPLDPHPAPTLFHPGSIVRARALRPTHPLLYGYPEVLTIFKRNDPLYQVAERDSGMVVLQYGTKERPRPDSGAMLGRGGGRGCG